jgi:hypothetical protein
MDVCIEPAGAERNGILKSGHLSILALLFALPWQEKHQSEIGQERSIELKIGPYTFIIYNYEDDRDVWKTRRAKQATGVLCMPLLMEHVCWVRLDGLIIDLGPRGYPE